MEPEKHKGPALALPADPFFTAADQWTRLITEDPRRVNNGEYKLCHASCVSEDCVEYADAWLESLHHIVFYGLLRSGENKGGIVQLVEAKIPFRKHRNIIFDVVYDWELAIKMADLHGHLGPWDSRLQKLPFANGKMKSQLVGADGRQAPPISGEGNKEKGRLILVPGLSSPESKNKGIILPP